MKKDNQVFWKKHGIIFLNDNIMRVVFYLLSGLILTNCSGRHNMKSGLIYPDVISPIYYLDTFQIIKPLVIFIDSTPYIISESILENTLDRNDLLEKKGVVRYLTENLTANRIWDYVGIYSFNKKTIRKSLYYLQYSNEIINIEDNLKFVDSLKGIAIYRFDIEPQRFMLTLITKKDSLIINHDVILGAEYSNDYMLAIAPIYSKQNLKKMQKVEYRRLNEEDPNWTYYLPNWLYNLLF